MKYVENTNYQFDDKLRNQVAMPRKSYLEGQKLLEKLRRSWTPRG